MGTRRRGLAAAAAAAVPYGWWFTDRAPFSRGAKLAWLGAVVMLVVAGEADRRRRPERILAPSARSRVGVAVWGALAIAVVTWELIALRSLPRSAHPTISSLTETAEQWHSIRVAFYAAWVAIGWAIAT